MRTRCPARSTMPGLPKYPSDTSRSRARTPRDKGAAAGAEEGGGEADGCGHLSGNGTAVRRYTDATTIIKRMAAELIQYIEVYPAAKEDGITNQRVTIRYSCIGAFEVPDRRKIPERDILLETRKSVALSYAPAQIAI